MNEGRLTVREFTEADEAAWLRCRALAFLATNYFDDVVTAKPTYAGASVELVGYGGDALAASSTSPSTGHWRPIETVATHPDFARSGVAGALLREALTRLPEQTVTLDAWTREDVAANRCMPPMGSERRSDISTCTPGPTRRSAPPACGRRQG